MSAKEMFEELGYIESENNNKGITYNYNFTDYSTYSFIHFNKKDEKIEMESNVINGYDITLQELKAINKQVEELGWNNE